MDNQNYLFVLYIEAPWPREDDEPSGFSSDFGGRPNRPKNKQHSRARTGPAANNAEPSVIRPYSDRSSLSNGQSSSFNRLQSRQRNNFGERRNSPVMLGFTRLDFLWFFLTNSTSFVCLFLFPSRLRHQ